MNLTPEMLAALPPEVKREMDRRLHALLAELGVRPKITQAGAKVFDVAEVAAALGMSVDEALAIAGEEDGGLTVVNPATLGSLQ